MSKRSATDTQDGQPFQKMAAGGSKRDMPAVDEMGEFEDEWEDDIEDDGEASGDEVVDRAAEELGGAISSLLGYFHWGVLQMHLELTKGFHLCLDYTKDRPRSRRRNTTCHRGRRCTSAGA